MRPATASEVRPERMMAVHYPDHPWRTTGGGEDRAIIENRRAA
jgi:hypothetical protein